ncbi:MAG: cobalamin B12-binding domain-containing protein [Pseudomonadota bacterium]
MDTQDSGTRSAGDPEGLAGFSDLHNALYAIPESVTQSFAKDVVARLTDRVLREREVGGFDPLAHNGPTQGEVETLCQALVAEDPGEAARIIDKARQSGRTADTLYLRYISVAARRLGEKWVEDSASFLEVTLGLARLHGILRALGPTFFADAAERDIGISALFVPVPGETHLLGLTMATDFFRRSGWRVDLQTSLSFEDLARHARENPCELIGLSAGCRAVTESLALSVEALRDACPEAVIAVGGYLTELEPDIAREVGADCIVDDVTVAAQSLLQRVKQRSASIDIAGAQRT